MAEHPCTDPHDADLVSSPARPRRRASAIALVAAGVVGGAAVGLSTGAFAAGGSDPSATAATSSASSSATAPPADGTAAPDGPGRGHHGRGDRFDRGLQGLGQLGQFGQLGQLGRALHGTATVPKAGGGYEQLVLQRGVVTAVSPTSLVVTSTDGFVVTYVLSADTKVKAAQDTLAALKVTARVAVVATVSGGTQQATRVIDLSAFAGKHGKHGHLRGGGPAGPVTPSPVTPSPGPAATGSAT